jgi:hypothetical protein
MIPHIAILKMTIEEQENLLAAREPGASWSIGSRA